MTLLGAINEAALDKKAANATCLNIQGQSNLCDFMYICSAENEKQAQAIAESIEEQCRKKLQVRPIAVEGKVSGSWILLDFGSTIVHVFLKEQRDYYKIEDLFPNAPRLSF
jgi:ribosome-associated protein